MTSLTFLLNWGYFGRLKSVWANAGLVWPTQQLWFPRYIVPKMDGHRGELVATVKRSLIFADSDDLDIWDWTHPGRPLRRIPDL